MFMSCLTLKLDCHVYSILFQDTARSHL